MPLRTVAILAAILLLLYHQFTTWLPMFPWNDLRSYTFRELLLEAGSNGAFMGLGILSLVLENKGFWRYYPLIYYPFLFFGEIMQWWVPYISAEFAKSKFNFDYDAKFSRTLKLIPHKPGARTPDASHTVLHLLTLAVIMLVYLDRLH